MENRAPSFSAWAVLASSSLVWIAVIVWVLVRFTGLSVTAGWITAGVLGVAALVGTTLMIYELRHAVDLSDDADPADAKAPKFPARWKRDPLPAARPIHASRSHT